MGCRLRSFTALVVAALAFVAGCQAASLSLSKRRSAASSEHLQHNHRDDRHGTAASSATRAYSRTLLQGSAPSAAPSTCTFTNATEGLRVSSCTPNQDFILYLANNSNLATNGSVYALSTLATASGVKACHAYNASTPEGQAACVADTANYCYLSLRNLQLLCSSAALVVTTPGQYDCPGSPGYDRDVCIASNRTACQANPNCTWNLLGAGLAALLTPGAVTDFQETWQNATNGTYSIDFGFCQYAPEFQAATAGTNGTYSWTQRYNYQLATLYSNDAATFYKYNGNCSAAQASFAANEYNNLCNSFNTLPLADGADFGQGLLRSDTPANVVAFQGCIESKCATNLYYTALYGPAYAPYLNYTGFYVCEPDTGIINSLFYTPEVDGPLFNNQVICNLYANQFDREACLSVSGFSSDRR